MISSLGDDSLIVGDMGAEIYMLAIPTAKNQEFVAKFYKDKGYYHDLAAKPDTATMFWGEAVKKADNGCHQGLGGPCRRGLEMRACDHQAEVPYWAVEVAKENKFFKHAFEGPVTANPGAEGRRGALRRNGLQVWPSSVVSFPSSRAARRRSRRLPPGLVSEDSVQPSRIIPGIRRTSHHGWTLITGGAGFIGSCVVRFLVEAGRGTAGHI